MFARYAPEDCKLSLVDFRSAVFVEKTEKKKTPNALANDFFMNSLLVISRQFFKNW